MIAAALLVLAVSPTPPIERLELDFFNFTQAEHVVCAEGEPIVCYGLVDGLPVASAWVPCIDDETGCATADGTFGPAPAGESDE